jgi:hypothetical protein
VPSCPPISPVDKNKIKNKKNKIFLEGKEENYFFSLYFYLSPDRFTQISSLGTCWMKN